MLITIVFHDEEGNMVVADEAYSLVDAEKKLKDLNRKFYKTTDKDKENE